jgi:hypothetical protein
MTVATPRSREELLEMLQEQISFLVASCQLFDQGSEYEAKRLAAVIRTLVRDTRNSKSLLGQLGILDSIPFHNSLPPMNLHNLIGEHGFVITKMSSAGAKYLPCLGERLEFVSNKEMPFSRWYSQVVYKNGSKEFTRKDFIGWLADKEGGAHVDPSSSPGYVTVRQYSEETWKFGRGNPETGQWEESPVDGNLVYVGVRQIAYEMLETLRRISTQ